MISQNRADERRRVVADQRWLTVRDEVRWSARPFESGSRNSKEYLGRFTGASGRAKLAARRRDPPP
jgi:hypothetical protein